MLIEQHKLLSLNFIDAFLYVFGSAGTGSTYHDNLKEFAKWKIVPRMLRDTTVRNIEVRAYALQPVRSLG